MSERSGQNLFLRAILLLLVLCLALPAAVQGAPAEPGQEITTLLGLYQHASGRFLLRERNGELEMLYDINPGEGEIVREYSVLPLRRFGGDAFRLVENGPLQHLGAIARFQRDEAGRGTACRIGEKTFTRRFYGPDKGETFKIKPLLTVDKLREIAAQAVPPVENGVFLEPDLVEVVALDNTIQLDIRYATTNNFMGMAMYKEPRAFLQRPAAEALVRAHRQLALYGYGIIIHDAYRPWTVTKMFWEATPPEQRVFVADPDKGSRHNRGGAVDISLYDRSTGKSIGMISGYDEFSPRAYPDFSGGTELQRWERELLRFVMEGEGFTVYPEEWWHFDYKGWQRFPIMNLEFSAIR